MRSSSLHLFSIGFLLVALGTSACGDDGGSSKKDAGGGAGGSRGGAGGSRSETDGAAGGAGKTDGAAGGVGKADGAAGGLGTDGGGLDLSGVLPPAMLTATVLNRRETTFELVWTAPSENGAAVAGYQIRYAKVPITTTNFDDSTVTTSAPYTGMPKAPGDTDGATVKAYIENGYYFAVTGTDATGNHVGTFMATATAVTAHFNVTTISSTSGTNEEFGYALDGSGDLNGDGYSDVIVGTFNSGKAYLFFGSSTFAASAPSVTLSGASTGFGTGVAAIGDIDNDGKEDFAVSDFAANGVVYIYKGRATWPLTLTDTQADYVISGDATYAASNFGVSMARLGDFNGDGIDDFAIGAANYNNVVARGGRVIVVLGKSGFGSIALPSTSNTITIDGDANLARPFFGYRVLGLGRFYSVTSGGTLVVSSPGGTAGTTNNEGRIYSFHGQPGTGGAIPIASADEVIVGPAAGARIGVVLSNLGPVTSILSNAGSGNPTDTFSVTGSMGTVFVGSGTTATGPFGTLKTVTQTASTTALGEALFGGGISGSSAAYSLLGSATPDIGTMATQGASIYIIDGAKITGLSATFDVASAAAATVNVPTGWPGVSESGGALIPDINGDGFPDFVISGVFGSVPGAIAIYW
jgi:hypothetical protein